MSCRSATAIALVLGATALTFAQPPAGSVSRALPPDKAVLDRLNLRAEWTLNLPILGGRDSIELVQTIDDQLFVQTRTGLLVVVDAGTGRIQWTAALGNGGYTNVYGVAANAQFVYVTNVTKLYAFYRRTGVTEFVTDLKTVPMTGLVADDAGVYAVLAGRPGSASTHRLVAFNLPHPIAVADAAKNASLPPNQRDAKIPNPVDDLTNRYPSPGVVRRQEDDKFERIGKRMEVGEVPVGGLSGSRSPSLAVLPSVTPPYRLEGSPTSPSLATIPSLRQPYHMRDSASRDIQRTPSLGTIPPSVAAALALSDLRPQGVAPPVRWEYGFASHVIFTPTLTPYRVWMMTDNGLVIALSKVDKTEEVYEKPLAPVSAPFGRAGSIGYAALADGQMYAAELLRGNKTTGFEPLWRTNVGGLLNREPFVTNDVIYAAGDDSGVTGLNRNTGDVIWRTDRSVDRVLAVNQDFAYLRDRQGRVHIYDARRASDPARKLSVPLTSVNFAEFNVPVVNTVSDRLYLAADNGLLVCLRDASPKYARPMRVAPELSVNTPPKEGVIVPKGDGKDPAPPKEALPPKEPVPPKDPTDAPKDKGMEK